MLLEALCSSGSSSFRTDTCIMLTAAQQRRHMPICQGRNGSNCVKTTGTWSTATPDPKPATTTNKKLRSCTLYFTACA